MWPQILASIGIKIPQGKEEFSILCPFHEDKVPSLSINIRKGVWCCHANCGQGSLVSFLARYLGKTEQNIFSLLKDRWCNEEFELLWGEEETATFDGKLKEVEFPPSFKFNQFPSWIFKRGFTREVLSRWGCGVNPNTNSLIIPIRDIENRLVGWASRRVEGEIPKYLYTRFPVSKVLFGANTIDKGDIIYIVEGPLDCMWLSQHGYKSVALLGSRVSKAQEGILTQVAPSEIVLCLDNDEAGEKGRKEIYPKVSKIAATSSITIPPGYKDVQDIRNPEELEIVIKNRSI